MCTHPPFGPWLHGKHLGSGRYKQAGMNRIGRGTIENCAYAVDRRFNIYTGWLLYLLTMVPKPTFGFTKTKNKAFRNLLA